MSTEIKPKINVKLVHGTKFIKLSGGVRWLHEEAPDNWRVGGEDGKRENLFIMRRNSATMLEYLEGCRAIEMINS